MTSIADSSGPGAVVVRRAVPQDVKAIARMLRQAAPETIPLAPVDLLRHLSQFEVLHHPTRGVVGAVAMRHIGDGRAELRSLVVDPCCRGLGAGSQLVRRVIDRARAEDLEIVCVTRRPRFFAGLGFREIPLAWIPEKPQQPTDPGACRRVAMSHRPRRRPGRPATRSTSRLVGREQRDARPTTGRARAANSD
jgi:amino-acid N-acetyltransferase